MGRNVIYEIDLGAHNYASKTEINIHNNTSV